MRALGTVTFFLALAPLVAVTLLGQPGLAAMLRNPAWVAATLRTLHIAEVAVPIALLLSVPAALTLWGAPLATRRIVLAVCALPILVPPGWSAAGLAYLADHAGIAGAEVAALSAARAAPAASLAFLILYAGLTVADPALLRVAMANAATPLQAWRIVILPHLAMAGLVAAVAAFVAAVGLNIADQILAPAYQPTLGSMLTVALRTADFQTASAALILAVLVLAPLSVVWCLLLVRRL
jgi:ABC-type spermidine/putrescine transport system permease subunit II